MCYNHFNMVESSQAPSHEKPVLPPPSDEPSPKNGGKSKLWIFILVGVLIVAGIGAAVYFLLQPSTPTDKIRDVFIIFMAVESIVIGIALVILMVQLAVLINLLQNEIKPILTSTSETVNTLRGTVQFLGDNLTEPVIKLNQYMAGFKKLLDLLRPGGK